MTDRLTQLQNAVDQFATQCFSALRYISDHHVALPTEPGEALATDVNVGRNVDTPEAFEGPSPLFPPLRFSSDPLY